MVDFVEKMRWSILQAIQNWGGERALAKTKVEDHITRAALASLEPDYIIVEKEHYHFMVKRLKETDKNATIEWAAKEAEGWSNDPVFEHFARYLRKKKD